MLLADFHTNENPVYKEKHNEEIKIRERGWVAETSYCYDPHPGKKYQLKYQFYPRRIFEDRRDLRVGVIFQTPSPYLKIFNLLYIFII